MPFRGWPLNLLVDTHLLLLAAGNPQKLSKRARRMLVAQAHVEGLSLLTSGESVAKYPGNVLKVYPPSPVSFDFTPTRWCLAVWT